MAVTEAEVRKHLDPEEPNYPAAAAALGAEALPVLERLVSASDPLLASKAAYLAALIPDPAAARVLEIAAGSPEATVRVAAAAGAQRRPELAAALESLLTDRDPGVRKVAERAAGRRERARAPVPPDDDHGGGPGADDDAGPERSAGEGGGSPDTAVGEASRDEGDEDGGGGGDLGGSGAAAESGRASDGPDGGGELPVGLTAPGTSGHGGGG